MIERERLENRVHNERLAHTEDDVLERSKELKGRFSHVKSYPSLMAIKQHVLDRVANVNGMKILDYGCGTGDSALKYIESGASVCGIDISDIYVDKAIKLMLENGVPRDRFEFEVMDAHNLRYPDEKFDMVIGNGILHHLEIELAMAEIYRVLKEHGRVILFEPLADNPLLKLFRRLTPEARTIDETPLSKEHIERIYNVGSWQVENMYCGIVEAPVAVMTSMLLPKNPKNRLLSVAHKMEKNLNRFGAFHRFNQYILISLVKK